MSPSCPWPVTSRATLPRRSSNAQAATGPLRTRAVGWAATTAAGCTTSLTGMLSAAGSCGELATTFAEYVPAASPVGSTVTLNACGVVPLAGETCTQLADALAASVACPDPADTVTVF